jgi:hypothetical protein
MNILKATHRLPFIHLAMDHIENTVLLSHACMLRALPSNGRCLQRYRLATNLYATIYFLRQIRMHPQGTITREETTSQEQRTH